jgi:hypothetical protein
MCSSAGFAPVTEVPSSADPRSARPGGPSPFLTSRASVEGWSVVTRVATLAAAVALYCISLRLAALIAPEKIVQPPPSFCASRPLAQSVRNRTSRVGGTKTVLYTHALQRSKSYAYGFLTAIRHSRWAPPPRCVLPSTLDSNSAALSAVSSQTEPIQVQNSRITPRPLPRHLCVSALSRLHPPQTVLIQ